MGPRRSQGRTRNPDAARRPGRRRPPARSPSQSPDICFVRDTWVQRFCLAGSRSTRVREPGRRETRTREMGRSLTSAGAPLGIPAPRKAVPDKGSASWPLLLPERARDWPEKGGGRLSRRWPAPVGPSQVEGHHRGELARQTCRRSGSMVVLTTVVGRRLGRGRQPGTVGSAYHVHASPGQDALLPAGPRARASVAHANQGILNLDGSSHAR